MALIKINGIFRWLNPNGQYIPMVNHSIAHHGVPRSEHWPAVRQKHLREQPTCAACGCSSDLEVHHILPFHLYPALELDSNNLITLCDPEKAHFRCHLQIGHNGDFHKFNPNVVSDSAAHLKTI